MRILIVILLFCYYEAFVNVYCAEETVEPFGNYVFRKSENLSEFAQKVFRPEAKEGVKLMKPDISTLIFQADQDILTMIYSVGDRNISNSFQVDQEFQEETWLSPATTVVHKDNETCYTWTSTLSTGRSLIREEIFSNEGLTVIMISPLVDFVSTLYYERV